MKKKVICLFSLILYLLLACTLLSAWIEAEMMTQAKVRTLKSKGNITLQLSSLFDDASGSHLYEVIDGTGWSGGLRVHEIPDTQWYIDVYGTLGFSGDARTYRFVSSASRQPRDGEQTAIVQEFTTSSDQYLYIFPQALPAELDLPDGAQLTAQSETALLLDMTQAQLPFFPHTALTLSDTTELASQAFSLTEVRRFLQALPTLILLPVALAGGVLFWLMACCQSIHARRNRRRIWLNGALMAASLLMILLVLRSVDLPASLMPVESILDWQHYRQELTLITTALNALGMDRLLDLLPLQQSIQVLLGGGGVLALIAAMEIILPRIRRKA